MKLHPDARERVTVYLRSDEALAATNDEAALDAYERDGDATVLTIPAEAARFVIHPLTATAASAAQRDAGDLPFDAIQVSRRVEARFKAACEAEPTADRETLRMRLMAEEGLTVDQWGPLQAWTEARALALCSLALVSTDIWPGESPARVAGLERYPVALLERLPMDARMELARHVERLSEPGAEGKACAPSRSGRPAPASRAHGAAPIAPPTCDAPEGTAAAPSPETC